MAQIELMKDFKLGDNKVGFKTERITDYSRTYGNSYRSIQMFVWYPASGPSIQPLTYAEYFNLNNPTGKSVSIPIDTLIQREIKALSRIYEQPIQASKYMELETIALLNAPPLDGDFPVLLFAPGGNTSSYLHSVLAEYLSSHGYVVVSFPSLGNIEGQRWPFDQVGIDIHIDDMSLIINHLKRTMPQVDIDKTGLLSWSVGGVSQGLLSMKNPTIDLFISLDSGIGRLYGVEMMKESPHFDYNKFNIPYLHLTGRQPEMYNVERSSEFYDSIASQNKYYLEIESFAHHHFMSQRGLIPSFAMEPQNTVIIDAYVDMSRLVQTFCDAYLKENSQVKQQWTERIENR